MFLVNIIPYSMETPQMFWQGPMLLQHIPLILDGIGERFVCVTCNENL